jgi:hypothetical protein
MRRQLTCRRTGRATDQVRSGWSALSRKRSARAAARLAAMAPEELFGDGKRMARIRLEPGRPNGLGAVHKGSDMPTSEDPKAKAQRRATRDVPVARPTGPAMGGLGWWCQPDGLSVIVRAQGWANGAVHRKSIRGRSHL